MKKDSFQFVISNNNLRTFLRYRYIKIPAEIVNNWDKDRLDDYVKDYKVSIARETLDAYKDNTDIYSILNNN